MGKINARLNRPSVVLELRTDTLGSVPCVFDGNPLDLKQVRFRQCLQPIMFPKPSIPHIPAPLSSRSRGTLPASPHKFSLQCGSPESPEFAVLVPSGEDAPVGRNPSILIAHKSSRKPSTPRGLGKWTGKLGCMAQDTVGSLPPISLLTFPLTLESRSQKDIWALISEKDVWASECRTPGAILHWRPPSPRRKECCSTSGPEQRSCALFLGDETPHGARSSPLDITLIDF